MKSINDKNRIGDNYSPSDMAGIVAQRTGFTKKDTLLVVRAYNDLIKERLMNGDVINLKYVKLGVKKRVTRKYYVPALDLNVSAKEAFVLFVKFSPTIRNHLKQYTIRLNDDEYAKALEEINKVSSIRYIQSKENEQRKREARRAEKKAKEGSEAVVEEEKEEADE